MYKKSKYSVERTQEIKMEALFALNESKIPLTLEEIIQKNGALVGVTTQKLSRVIGELCDFGFAEKAYDKTRGKMVYGTITTMRGE